jgi:hypothetical protein
MNVIAYFIDLFLHLDEHLSLVIAQYGTGTYLLLFFIIFMETGFVVTPFLPGGTVFIAVHGSRPGRYSQLLDWALYWSKSVQYEQPLSKEGVFGKNGSLLRETRR